MSNQSPDIGNDTFKRLVSRSLIEKVLEPTEVKQQVLTELNRALQSRKLNDAFIAPAQGIFINPLFFHRSLSARTL